MRNKSAIALKKEEFRDYYDIADFDVAAHVSGIELAKMTKINDLIENCRYGTPVCALVAKESVRQDLEPLNLAVLVVLDDGTVGRAYGYDHLHCRATYFEEVSPKEVHLAVVNGRKEAI